MLTNQAVVVPDNGDSVDIGQEFANYNTNTTILATIEKPRYRTKNSKAGFSTKKIRGEMHMKRKTGSRKPASHETAEIRGC